MITVFVMYLINSASYKKKNYISIKENNNKISHLNIDTLKFLKWVFITHKPTSSSCNNFNLHVLYDIVQM